MITIKLTGVQDAATYLRFAAENLGKYATDGTEDAGIFIANRIQSITGDTAYAISLEVNKDEAQKRTLIAPSPTSIVDIKTKRDRTYMWRHFHCPYWKYIQQDKLAGISWEPELDNIVTNALDEIKGIIVKRITGVFK